MTVYQCKNCPKKSESIAIKKHSNNKYKTTATCLACNISWQVCFTCNKRWCRRKTSEATKHFNTQHQDESDGATTTTSNKSTNVRHRNINLYDYEAEMSTTIVPSFLNSAKEPNLNNSYMSNISKRFFSLNMQGKNNGIKNIVFNAFLRSESDYSMAELEESILQMKITQHCKTLSYSQQMVFLDILNSIRKNKFKATRLPESINDIKSFHLSNKYSIFQNLPTPKIRMNHDHAYISLVSLIDHFLSFNLEMNYMTCDENNMINTGISKCKMALQMRNSVKEELKDSNISPMILYINLWSDDFEPNVYRKNRKSIWIKTVSICPPRDKITSPMYTYVLAIGRKTDNHDIMHEFYNRELEDLSKCAFRYCALVKKNVPIVVKILSISADRPERSAINHILGHNGTTTKRWLYSAYIDQTKLPSCKECLKSRLKKVAPNNNTRQITLSMFTRNCRTCCDWDYSRKSQHLGHEIPEAYPVEQHDDSPEAPIGRSIKVSHQDRLYPVKLEYNWLKQGCRFSFHNIFHGVWSRHNAYSYHQSIGINKKLSEKIITQALELKEKNPNHPNPSNTLQFPPYWSMNIKLYQCIDTPMHLLFQGIIKSVIEISIVLLKKHSKNTMFAQNVHSIMNKIKSVHCEFCRVETFNGNNQTSLGGWVAENYLGFSRVMICILSQASQLLSQVNNMQGLMEYEFCIQACFCFISRLMTKNHVSSQEIDDYTKLFLASIHYLELESGIREEHQDFIWYSRPNFLSILNLSDQIDKFGCIRDYWEGTFERFIQYVKPFMKNVRNSESYLGLQLSNIHKSHLLNNLIQQFEDSIQTSYERHKNVIIYASIQVCQHSAITGEVLLGIIVNEYDGKCVFSLCKKDNGIGLYQIDFDDDHGYHKCGMWYTNITFQESKQHIRSTNELDQYSFDYFIGIPDYHNQDNEVIAYTILSKNWTCRKQSGDFMLPIISYHIIEHYKSH